MVHLDPQESDQGYIPPAGIWPANLALVLPKHGTIFELRLCLKDHQPHERRVLSFELSGSQMAHRATERVTRKLKSRPSGEFGPDGLP
jgi:hypothetical protein